MVLIFKLEMASPKGRTYQIQFQISNSFVLPDLNLTREKQKARSTLKWGLLYISTTSVVVHGNVSDYMPKHSIASTKSEPWWMMPRLAS